jgi:hypothetical protein
VLGSTCDRRRRLTNGLVTTSEREIVLEEAAIVRRIFSDYAADASPKQIAEALDAEPCPWTAWAPWMPGTIHGSEDCGVGILHNDPYVAVWYRIDSDF